MATAAVDAGQALEASAAFGFAQPIEPPGFEPREQLPVAVGGTVTTVFMFPLQGTGSPDWGSDSQGLTFPISVAGSCVPGSFCLIGKVRAIRSGGGGTYSSAIRLRFDGACSSLFSQISVQGTGGKTLVTFQDQNMLATLPHLFYTSPETRGTIDKIVYGSDPIPTNPLQGRQVVTSYADGSAGPDAAADWDGFCVPLTLPPFSSTQYLHVNMVAGGLQVAVSMNAIKPFIDPSGTTTTQAFRIKDFMLRYRVYQPPDEIAAVMVTMMTTLGSFWWMGNSLALVQRIPFTNNRNVLNYTINFPAAMVMKLFVGFQTVGMYSTVNNGYSGLSSSRHNVTRSQIMIDSSIINASMLVSNVTDGTASGHTSTSRKPFNIPQFLQLMDTIGAANPAGSAFQYIEQGSGVVVYTFDFPLGWLPFDLRSIPNANDTIDGWNLRALKPILQIDFADANGAMFPNNLYAFVTDANAWLLIMGELTWVMTFTLDGNTGFLF